MSSGLVYASDDMAAMQQVFEITAKHNIENVQLDDLLALSLQGINKMDKGLKFANDGDHITLYQQGKMIKTLAKPQENNPQDWVRLAEEAQKLAIKYSKTISLHDFELTDEMMVALVDGLKDDSKYYKAMDLVDNSRFSQRQNFGAYADGEILVVRMRLFDENSKEKLRQAIEKNTAAQAMILDLRGNSGGSLAAMVEIADMLMDEGIIIYTRGTSDDADKFYMSKEGELFANKPIVILVDKNTASSAEGLTAAMQEQGRAKVVGTRTYGKGSVQDLYDLANGSKLSLTSALIYTPSGKEIRGQGINPDICMAFMKQQKPEFLIRQVQKGDCPRQERENEKLDMEVATALIQKKL